MTESITLLFLINKIKKSRLSNWSNDSKIRAILKRIVIAILAIINFKYDVVFAYWSRKLD